MRSTRAAGVSPPWVGKRTCRAIRFAFGEQPHEERRASARRGTEKRTCNGERFPGTDYVRHAPRASAPRGAYAPRSCVAVRMSAGKKAIFAMDERMFTRAAGVSPPWVTTCQQRRYGTRSDTVITPDQERWSPVLRALRNTVTMIPHLPAVRCRTGKVSHHAEVGPGVVRTVRRENFWQTGLDIMTCS